MQLRTARLVLRRAVPSDLAAFHAILSSPRAMRYWSTLPHQSMAVTEAWFEQQFFSGDPARDEWVIAQDDKVVGNIGIWNMPEFGFILHPDAWGRGIGTEAATAFLRYAFATHPIDGITADVDPRNAASLALLHKLGFVETGRAEHTFLVGSEWCDSVYLMLPRAA
ncbi:MAG: GNAT family N-acetyltransferase [Devosia sp.]|uniref:GNAT family N-acetyltransferase n=1 Tax=Devosia sp. TaxID=1871048 RepID=UPI001ACCAC56|nr:GNAT family N-acetyltransferase [Devosia sp.]MBN9314466.1 GNAT family N-acetyltransferase [Devosia sp.]